jgi:hypothetical protein
MCCLLFAYLIGSDIVLLHKQICCWKARSHTANTVLAVLNKHFHYRVLSDRFPARFKYWLVLASILFTCHLFLCGFLKDTIYRNIPHTIQGLIKEVHQLRSASENTAWRVHCRATRDTAYGFECQLCTYWKCFHLTFTCRDLCVQWHQTQSWLSCMSVNICYYINLEPLFWKTL